MADTSRALPVRISAFTLTSALGAGLAPTLAALREGRTGLVRKCWETVDFESFLGEVAGLDAVALPDALRAFDCRNNRLAWLALGQDDFLSAAIDARERHTAGRVGLFLGTSTSGILSTEQAYRQRDAVTGALPPTLDYRRTHNSYSVAAFVRSLLGLRGPAAVVSTACSASAKVFGCAQRMMSAGLIDAAIVGGVDSLCLTTLYGFQSLQLVSQDMCRPFSADRDGISIGEGAGFFLLESVASARDGDALLVGVGESSDAHHMSAPHPEGLGARQAIQSALDMAGLEAADIDYINLHGTATPSNDAAEDKAVTGLFGTATPCSSTKGHTGHTLGAAGAVEAAISLLALRHGLAPRGLGTEAVDSRLACHYLTQNRALPLRHVLSNSFGFGGSNCSLLFSRLEASAC